MTTERIVQRIEVSKREYELYCWLEEGIHTWQDAFYQYKGRKGRTRDSRAISSWFNSSLKGLKSKGLCKKVPFVIPDSPFGWFNPMLDSNGSELTAHVIHITDGERLLERNKIL